MHIIDELEQQQPRGPYAGSLGFFSLSGAVDLSVVIRTLMVADDGVRIGAGGAIVQQSDPVEEFDEVLLKLRAPLLALARTMDCDGVDFGPKCDGERLKVPAPVSFVAVVESKAVGDPLASAFTTRSRGITRIMSAVMHQAV
jgi:hypothetical protein